MKKNVICDGDGCESFDTRLYRCAWDGNLHAFCRRCVADAVVRVRDAIGAWIEWTRVEINAEAQSIALLRARAEKREAA